MLFRCIQTSNTRNGCLIIAWTANKILYRDRRPPCWLMVIAAVSNCRPPVIDLLLLIECYIHDYVLMESEMTITTELHRREMKRAGAGLHPGQNAFDMQMSARRRYGEHRASSGKAEQVLSGRCAGALVISGTSRYRVVYAHAHNFMTI